MRLCDDLVQSAPRSGCDVGLMQLVDSALLTTTEDEALLDELRAAVSASDPVPAAVQAAARSALAWNRFEAAFAELVAAGCAD